MNYRPNPLASRPILLAAALIPATLALLAAAGCSGTPPKLKEGMWEIRGESIEKPGDKKVEFGYRLCRDRKFDKRTNESLKNTKGCNTHENSLGDGKFSSASSCAVAGTTVISTGLAVFQSNTSTHFETHATYNPPFNGKTEETLTQDQRYLGPCPQGMLVGDRMGGDGIVFHHDN